MSRTHGKDVKVYVGDGATPEVFSALTYQSGGNISLSGDELDASTKDDGGWGATVAGRKKATVSISGIADHADAPLTRIKSLYDSQASGNFWFVLDAGGNAYSGAFSVTSLEFSGDDNAVSNYSISLSNDGAVTLGTVTLP